MLGRAALVSNGGRAEQCSQASARRAASSSAVTTPSERESDSPPRRTWIESREIPSWRRRPPPNFHAKHGVAVGSFSGNNDAHPRHIRSGKNCFFLRIACIIGVSDESDRDRVRKKENDLSHSHCALFVRACKRAERCSATRGARARSGLSSARRASASSVCQPRGAGAPLSLCNRRYTADNEIISVCRVPVTCCKKVASVYSGFNRRCSRIGNISPSLWPNG